MAEASDEPRLGVLVAWLRVAARLLKQSVVPILLAAAYTFWDRHVSKQGTRTLSQDIKTFAAALFFLMWLAGQFLRVKKQVHDEDSFKSLEDGLRRVEQAVQAQQARAAVPPPVAEPPPAGPPAGEPPVVSPPPAGPPARAELGAAPPPPESGMRDVVARTLVHDASVALQAGLVHSGLLTLAVAFEHAVRQAALAIGVAEADQAPIPRLLSYLTEPLGGTANEMKVLWDARNMLVHRKAEWALSEADAHRLVDGYRWAIRLLDQVAHPISP